MAKKPKDEIIMEKSNAGADAMKWEHRFAVNGRAASGSKRTGLYFYKYGLFAHDLVLALVSFVLGALIIGYDLSLKENLHQNIGLFVIAVVSISFFMSYHLYNYHIIYTAKNHVKNLLKSFMWGGVVYFLVAFLYTWPDLLDGSRLVFLTVVVTVSVLLLGRILSDSQLNIIKAVGMGFVVVGLLGLIISDEKPQVVSNWAAVPIGLLIVVPLSLISRYFLVHQVFSKWMRQSFRRQVAIIGSGQEAETARVPCD